VLINNAAAAGAPFKLTVDNLETQLATGHIGPFLFTKLLAPKLLAATTPSYTPRVVFLSSVAHAMAKGIDFDALEHPTAEKYQMFGNYCQTKSANVLTAIELSKRSKGAINAYSLHPGGTTAYRFLVYAVTYLTKFCSHLHKYSPERRSARRVETRRSVFLVFLGPVVR
jgi:NAD(P)-dependent dehydrogenase (short-subunit alcohol dehydrogenase family)